MKSPTVACEATKLLRCAPIFVLEVFKNTSAEKSNRALHFCGLTAHRRNSHE